ncbi:hypothetical protein NSX52_23860, partial [Salmonella enterica]|nr:hypothetical protein [Salmonella enterica]
LAQVYGLGRGCSHPLPEPAAIRDARSDDYGVDPPRTVIEVQLLAAAVHGHDLDILTREECGDLTTECRMPEDDDPLDASAEILTRE